MMSRYLRAMISRTVTPHQTTHLILHNYKFAPFLFFSEYLFLKTVSSDNCHSFAASPAIILYLLEIWLRPLSKTQNHSIDQDHSLFSFSDILQHSHQVISHILQSLKLSLKHSLYHHSTSQWRREISEHLELLSLLWEQWRLYLL